MPRPGFVLEVDRSTPPTLFWRGENFSLEKLPAGRSRVIYAPEPLPAIDDGTYYHADLVGLAAELVSGEILGKVTAIYNFGAGDILEIASASGETTMLPFTRACVPVVDIANGRIVISPPAEIEAREE